MLKSSIVKPSLMDRKKGYPKHKRSGKHTYIEQRRFQSTDCWKMAGGRLRICCAEFPRASSRETSRKVTCAYNAPKMVLGSPSGPQNVPWLSSWWSSDAPNILLKSSIKTKSKSCTRQTSRLVWLNSCQFKRHGIW